MVKWELSFAGLLPRAAPRRLAIAVLGDLMPCRFARAVFAPLVRYGLEWWLAVHRPNRGLRPAALVEAFRDGMSLWLRVKGAWGKVRHHPTALAYGAALRLGWVWEQPDR